MPNQRCKIDRTLFYSYALLQLALSLDNCTTAATAANFTPQTNTSIQIKATTTTTMQPFLGKPLTNDDCTSLRCQCRWKIIKCYMNESGVRILIDGKAEKSSTRVLIICDTSDEGAQKSPPYTRSAAAELPYQFFHNKVKYKLENCTLLPDILQLPNISYTGRIKFSERFQVPATFFQRTHNLVRLKVEIGTTNARVNELPPTLFHTLRELRELHLFIFCETYEVALPPNLFHKLYKLEFLGVCLYPNDLDEYTNTALRNLTSAHFRDVRQLKVLILDGNAMQALHADLFASLSELTELSFKENQLMTLPSNLLRAQLKLTKLDISGNLLQALPIGIFDNTPLLSELTLANNQLHAPTNIMTCLKLLRYLYHLDLSYNHFETIEGAYGYKNRTLLTAIWQARAPAEHRVKTRNLTIINLSHNRLKSFKMEYISAAGIECPYKTDFSNNHMQHIFAKSHPSQSVYECEVDLEENPLICDCALAWIYITNFTIAQKWKCVGANHTVHELRSKRNICPWTPAFCPKFCTCDYDANELLINCTAVQLERIEMLPRPEQFLLNATTLDITYNQFFELPSNLTFGYANVTRIYAAHNRLTIIQRSHLPPRDLFSLDLRWNRLERLSVDFLQFYLNETATLQELYLSANPWLCDCEAELLIYTLRAHRSRIPDAAQLRCANLPNNTLLQLNFADICAIPPMPGLGLMRLLLGISVAASLLISILAIYYKYNLEVHVWLYAHDLFLCCIREQELDRNKTFDAFISYAHQDEHFVNHTLRPGLEQFDPPFRLCTHERNWLPGAYIPEQIVESVAQSRRTIIVLSQHFIESDWGRMEFRTAHQRSLNEGRARLIIIKYGEITNMSAIDKELRAYMEMNTYLQWKDHPWFWSKLYYAMPHRKGEARREGMMLELGDRRREYVMGEVEMRNSR